MSDANRQQLRFVKYVILQTTIGPSIACDIFVLIHFSRCWRREIINAPQNHVILCLLLVSFIQKLIDGLFLLYYLRSGVALQKTSEFCASWDWIDYSSTSISLYLLTWCCVERHLFIFHSGMMKVKRWLIFLHYLPLLLCLIYPPLFYFVVIFFPSSCTNIWDYSVAFCSGACYSFVPFLGAFDWIIHYGTPIILIVLTNILLISRVIHQRIRHRRPVRWSRQRRLILQLTFISLLYLTFSSPQVIIGVIQAIWAPDLLVDIQYDYFYYMAYFANQFLPFVIFSSLPTLHREVNRWFQRIKRYLVGRTRVGPHRINATIIEM